MIAIDAWQYTANLGQARVNELAALQGYNGIVAAIHQFVQVFMALDPVDKLGVKLHWTAKTVISLSPLAILGIKHQTQNKVWQFVHRNFGAMVHVAYLACCIALLRFGIILYAGVAICQLAIDYAVRAKWFPTKARQIYSSVAVPLHHLALVIRGDWLSKAIAAIDLADNAYSVIKAKREIPYSQVPERSNLRMEDFEAIMDQRARVDVTTDHINIVPFPQVKCREYGKIFKLFESKAWDEALLAQKLNVDPRWKDSKEKTSGDMLGYVRRNLTHVIYAIEHECIETGEPLCYAVLQNYLGYIAENLHKCTDAVQRTLLLQLAVEGGNYCGSGVYEQLETAAMLVMTGQKGLRLPLRQRILLILQQERLKVAKAFHILVGKVNKAINTLAGGDSDVHAFNNTVNNFAYDFGLPDQGAKHDVTATASYIERYYRQRITGLTPEHLWSGVLYDGRVYHGYRSRIVNAIHDQVGISWLPKTDIRQWALDWIKHAARNEAEKEAFIERLQDGRIFEDDVGFYDEFLMAMLVDMGIMRLRV